MYVHVARHRGSIIDFSYDNNGNKKVKVYNENLNLQLGVQTEAESKWKTLSGKNLKVYHFDDIFGYKNFIKENEDLIDVYGNIDPVYQHINQYHLNQKINLSYIKTFAFDIEVEADEGFPDPETTPKPITSISVKDLQTNRYYVVSRKPYNKWKNILNIDPKSIHFYNAPDEQRLFIWFIKLVEKLKPDILIGWYSDNFDFPYVINRSYVVFGGEDVISRISPYGDVRCDANDNGPFGQRAFRTIIGGIYTLDYMRLYKKFLTGKPRESYSLDYISEVELKEHKLKFEASNLTELWKNNPQLYVDYNIYDVELISLLDQKLKLINLLATLAYKTNCNFHDALGTVRMWDVFLYNNLHSKNIMIPPNIQSNRDSFAGAYVKEPVCDIYNWILSLDLNSLYPHLQQQFNISPECLVKGIKEDVDIDEIDKKLLNMELKPNVEYILAGNGCYFRKDKEGFIPIILKEIYAERKQVKKEMLKKKQVLVDMKNKLEKMEA